MYYLGLVITGTMDWGGSVDPLVPQNNNGISADLQDVNITFIMRESNVSIVGISDKPCLAGDAIDACRRGETKRCSRVEKRILSDERQQPSESLLPHE